MKKIVVIFFFLLISLQTKIAVAQAVTIEITGVSQIQKKQLLANLSLAEERSEPTLNASRVHLLFTQSETEILSTLEALGYYHATIEKKLSQQDNQWQARFVVTLGKPILLSEIKITTTNEKEKSDPLIKNIITHFPELIINQTITHESYEKTKEDILTKLHSIGYLAAYYHQSTLLIDKQQLSAKVIFTINTGPLYYFGDITFVNPDADINYLNKYITIENNSRYQIEKIAQIKKNLLDTDLFNKVRIDSYPDLTEQSNLTVPIKIRLFHKPKNRYSGSIGFGSDTGVRGSLGWQRRAVTNTGHSTGITIEGSKVKRAAQWNYYIPGKQPITDYHMLGAKFQKETIQKKFSQKGELFASHRKKRSYLQQNWTVSYLQEDFRFFDDDPITSQKYLLPSLQLTWLNIHQQKPYPIGTRIDLTIKGAHHKILSDNNLFKAEINIKKIISLNMARLILRGTAGGIFSEQFSNLPISLRFFAGGDNSVRGFRYQSLGPRRRNPTGETRVIGGRYLLLASAEIEQPIWRELSSAIFIDSGNAMNELNDNLAFGTGIGLRWATPIGAFRFDIAKPLNQVEEKNIRFHLSFGLDF